MHQNSQLLEDQAVTEVENELDTCALSIVDPLKIENNGQGIKASCIDHKFSKMDPYID